MKINTLKIIHIAFTMFFAQFVFGQIPHAVVNGNGEAYARGKYVEIGLRTNGAFGAQAGVPAGYHSSRSSNGFGFIANPLQDNWAKYDGCFFTPGGPYECWGVSVGGNQYLNHCYGTQITGNFISSNVSVLNCIDNTAQLTWVGSIGALGINRKYEVTENGLYIRIVTTLTNNGAGAMSNIFLGQEVDADNNYSLNGTYGTTNTFVNQPTTGTDNVAFATCTQPAGNPLNDPDGSSLGLLAFDLTAKCTYNGTLSWYSGGTSSIVNSWNTANPEGYSIYVDGFVSLVFNVGTLPAGASVTKTFYYYLGTDLNAVNSIGEPVLSTSTATATCPSTTVNLNSYLTSTLPSGSVVEWYTNPNHTGTPVSNPSAASAGTYYAVFHNASANCYSLASNPLTVTVPCCIATITPPLTATTLTNVCPATTVNLNGLHTATVPSGATLVWFTNNAHTGTAVATPSAATAGTYYAFYFDAVNNCYSPASIAVNVTTTSCCDAVAPTLSF